MIVVYVWMQQRCIWSCTSRIEVGSSRLLGIVGQPMYLLRPVIPYRAWMGALYPHSTYCAAWDEHIWIARRVGSSSATTPTMIDTLFKLDVVTISVNSSRVSARLLVFFSTQKARHFPLVHNTCFWTLLWNCRNVSEKVEKDMSFFTCSLEIRNADIQSLLIAFRSQPEWSYVRKQEEEANSQREFISWRSLA
jgi:hypothetical protein